MKTDDLAMKHDETTMKAIATALWNGVREIRAAWTQYRDDPLAESAIEDAYRYATQQVGAYRARLLVSTNSAKADRLHDWAGKYCLAVQAAAGAGTGSEKYDELIERAISYERELANEMLDALLPN